ncbi:hypothetical protein ABPG73_018694 [Tetrahymena malaccensis]
MNYRNDFSFQKPVSNENQSLNNFQYNQYQNLTLNSYQMYLQNQDQHNLNKLKNGNESEVILSDIISQFTQCVQQQTSKKKNVVFIIGNTGSGKTTLAAFLSGINLVVKKNEFNENIINYEQQRHQLDKKIGQNVLQSETSFPNIFESNSCVYIDCPGFQDTKQTKADIINSFFIHYFQQIAFQAKIILLIDGSLLECKGLSNQRCQPYKEQIQYLISMTKNTSFDISRNLLIVISKTTKQNIKFYQEKLRKVFQDLTYSIGFIQQLNETNYFNHSYSFFLNLKYTKIVTFPSPPKDGNYEIYNTAKQNIEQTLSSMPYYYKNDFKVPLSINSYQYLLKLESEIQIVLKNQLKNALNTLRTQIQFSQQLLKNYKQLINELIQNLENPTQSTSQQQLINLINSGLITPIQNQLSFSYQQSAKNDIQQQLKYIEFLSNFAYNLFFSKISQEFVFEYVFKKIVLAVLKKEVEKSTQQQQVLLNQQNLNQTKQNLSQSTQQLQQQQQMLNQKQKTLSNYQNQIQMLERQNQQIKQRIQYNYI